MKVVIKDIGLDDLEYLREKIIVLYEELFGDKAPVNDDNIDDIIAQLKGSAPRHWAFSVTHEGDLVGVFTLAEGFSFFASGCYGVINELWVDKGHRSAEVVVPVVEFIKDYAVKRGWGRLDVSVPAAESGDGALRFYEKNGFELIGRKLKFVVK